VSPSPTIKNFGSPLAISTSTSMGMHSSPRVAIECILTGMTKKRIYNIFSENKELFNSQEEEKRKI
jgi:hypothetical protein